MTTCEENDHQLLVSWQAGDRGAGERLFGRHYEALMNYFRTKVDRSVQCDLVQETFRRCIETLSRFRRASTFRTYLFGIAYNVLREYLQAKKREYRHRAQYQRDWSALMRSRHAHSPERVMARRHERRLLLEGLRRLPLHYQITLELHYWEHLSLSEIAKITCVPLGTARTRLRDGRKRLSRTIAELSSTSRSLF